jgi:hypothetical protein
MAGRRELQHSVYNYSETGYGIVNFSFHIEITPVIISKTNLKNGRNITCILPSMCKKKVKLSP